MKPAEPKSSSRDEANAEVANGRSSHLPESIETRMARLETVHRIGLALTAEKNRDRLLETILRTAQELCHADGGTLYLVREHDPRTDDDDTLEFAILRNDSLDVSLGGTTGSPVDLPPIPLYLPGTDGGPGCPNRNNVATAAVHLRESVHIPDSYDAEGFDFSGTRKFDERSGYRSKSFFTVPLINGEGRVIGVLQLLNALDPDTGEVVEFRGEHRRTVEALASQAGVVLDNQLLLAAQKDLLQSFIELLAAAIDAKSPYTGAHCERVPTLAQMLVRSLCDTNEGKFADFDLSDDEWYELKIAAWLHDCGKVTTPVHVMDKATKLETIFDRIEIVRERFAILERDSEIAHLRAVASGADPAASQAEHDQRVAALRADLAFLEVANVGGEFLPPEKQARIAEIGQRTYIAADGTTRRLLSEEEVENLSISRGTLTNEERLVINGHMVQTTQMLESLPLPRHLRQVPEIACGHHERMDGTGYPKGIYAGDLSVPARVMAIADVFEALTANDRPYKKAKRLSEAMRIMGFMKKDNHLDPDLFDHFVRSGIYRAYAERYLTPELIDEVDEAALLAIEPKPFDLPPDEVRRRRFEDFLPEYLGQKRPELRAGPSHCLY